MENCKELFLDDVIEISVHPTEDCKIPIPFAVQGIENMRNVWLRDPVMRIAYSDAPFIATEGSITAKSTGTLQGAGIAYAMEFNALLQGDSTEISHIYKDICNSDHYVCLYKVDGTILFCYTLPGTFTIKAPVNIQGGESCQVTMTLKSNSNFIPVIMTT